MTSRIELRKQRAEIKQEEQRKFCPCTYCLYRFGCMAFCDPFKEYVDKGKKVEPPGSPVWT